MASLQIPLALWRNAPELSITRALTVSERGWLFLGLASGLILQMVGVGEGEDETEGGSEGARLWVVMQGHAAPIVALDVVQQGGDQGEAALALLSLDSRGDVGLWSLDDGRCLLYNATGIPGRASNLLISSDGSLAYVLGHFNSVLILRLSTLEILKSIELPVAVWTACAVRLPPRQYQGQPEEQRGEDAKGLDVLLIFPTNGSSPIRLMADLETVSCVSLDCLALAPSEPAPARIECCIVTADGWVYFCDLQRCWLLKQEAVELAWSCDTSFIASLSLYQRHPLLYLKDGSTVHLHGQGPPTRQPPLPASSPSGAGLLARWLLPWRDGELLYLEEGVGRPPEIRSIGSPKFRNLLQLSDQRGGPASITATTIYEYRGEERVVHGFADGSIQIMTLFDGFMSFTAMTDTTVTLERAHQAAITCLLVYEGGEEELLISGDRAGALTFWNLADNSVLERFYHHAAAPLLCVPLRQNMYTLWISIDQEGRAALINRQAPHVISFVGTHRIPLKLLRLTGDGEDIRVALIDVHNQVQLWNLTSGRRERECSLDSSGAEELLRPFTRYYQVPHRRGSSADNGLCPFDQRHPLLGSVFSWRLAEDPVREPFQIAVLDVRKLVTNIKQLIKTEGKTDRVRLLLRRVLGFVMSLLLPWGVDEEMDKFAHGLGFSRPKRQIVAGVMGANGNFSFQAPSGERHWSSSGHVSGSHFLALSSIFELPLVEVGDDWDNLRMAFSTRLLDSGLASGRLALPSFSYASKYWHDLNEDIRHASRLMIVQTLARMQPSDIGQIIRYWQDLLPAAEGTAPGGGGRRLNRAAIILGILAVHRPECLDEALRGRLTESLMNLLMDDKRNLFRSAAIELIGKAYPVWQGHVQPLSLFRLLLGWLVNMSVIDERDGAVQLVVPYDSASTIDTLEAVRGTLLKLVRVAPQEIVPSWLGEDFSSSRSLLERWICISLISDLVRAKPVVLRPYLILVVEAVCKLLEGGGHSLPVSSGTGGGRGRLQLIAMPLLEDLVQAYSTVSLHHPSLRLAVAVPGSLKIQVFDLRGYTSPRLCEGNTHPVTALSFSPDGRILLAYSMAEATLRWWLLPSGLFGLFSGVLKPFQTIIVDPCLTEAARAHTERVLENPASFPGVEMVRFVWKQGAVAILVADEIVWEVPLPGDV